MQQVAQAWLVLEITDGDPFWLGVVAAAQFVPVMILGLFAGVLADSLPKRQTLMAAQAAMMVLAIILTILSATGLVEVWMVVVLALALACANAVDMPVRQSFAIEMVGPKDVGNAVSLNSAMFNGARVIGPAIAGLTIGAFGVTVAFAINAVSFLAVIIGLSMMRDSELYMPRLVPRPKSVGDVVANLTEGLRFVRRTPVVLMAVVSGGARGHLRHELQRARPAARLGRAPQRRRGLRVPHDRVRPRRPGGGGRPRRRWSPATSADRARWHRPGDRVGHPRAQLHVRGGARADVLHRSGWHHDGGHSQCRDPAIRARSACAAG